MVRAGSFLPHALCWPGSGGARPSKGGGQESWELHGVSSFGYTSTSASLREECASFPRA